MTRSRRRVCVAVGSRANYASIKSAMAAVHDHPDLELQLVVGASALLDRYGSVIELIEADGFRPVAKVFMLVEGETPATMAKSTGLGLMELPTILEQIRPDVVLTVGDRFETMATTLAATYMNLPLAHTMGGEVSGNIDESIRHAVTKFAHIHFPACEDAHDRIIRLGEAPDRVFNVGCPRIDLIARILEQDDMRNNGVLNRSLFEEGVGGAFDLARPFILISQHPVTHEYGQGEDQITATMEAVREVGLPAIALWPNADAGSDDVARGMRKFRERHYNAPIHYFKNLSVEVYVKLMARTACLVGNSSSAIRDGAYIGTPAVNVGSRQARRQRGANVLDSSYDRESIAAAIRDRVGHGRFPSQPIYGDGRAGKRIAEILSRCSLDINKTITY